MLSRRLISRVLIVPPAGLVGNWEREMRTLFRLPFRIFQRRRRTLRQSLPRPRERPSYRQHPRDLFNTSEESKFEKLREVLSDPQYLDEKLIIFTEHRDTAEFLVRRLEGLGFIGQVALIHGGLPYQERERQVEFFRRPAAEDGANYLVATDAAGEGINLQFCWLMVNYDIPWNPARLEQRMGRIHRYGQKHDPVVIVNLKEVRHIGLMGEELAAFLNTMKSTDEKQFRGVEKALHALMPNIDGIEVEVSDLGEVELRLREGGVAIPARVLSEGTLRMLGLLALTGVDEAPALVGFEEPTPRERHPYSAVSNMRKTLYSR